MSIHLAVFIKFIFVLYLILFHKIVHRLYIPIHIMYKDPH